MFITGKRIWAVLGVSAIMVCGCATTLDSILESLSDGQGGTAPADLLDLFGQPTDAPPLTVGDGALAPGRPLPESSPVTIQIMNQSESQAATVHIDFFLDQPSPAPRLRQVSPQITDDGLVHRTLLSLPPGAEPVLIGPELANRVHVTGSLADGSPLPTTEYVFPTDFSSDAGSLIVHMIVDPPKPPTADPEVPDDPIEPDVPEAPDDEVIIAEVPDEDETPDDTGGNIGGNNGGPPPIVDCDGNGIDDAADIADCLGEPLCGDCNGNGVPDGCDPDCNQNGIPDDCDVALGGPLFGSTGVDDSRIYTIDLTTGQATLFVDMEAQLEPPFNLPPSSGLVMSPDGQTLFVSPGGEVGDPLLLRVDVLTAQGTVVGDIGQNVSELVFLPDGTMIGSAPSDKELVTIDPDSGATTTRCSTDPIKLSGLAISAQGVVYGTTGGQNPSGTLFLVDPNTCELTQIGEGTGFGRVPGLTFLPDGRLIGSTRSELIEIDTATGLGTLIANIIDASDIDGLAFGGSVDCNDNGVPDTCDIANGTSSDSNENGVPDECELGPDCNNDGIPDDQVIADCAGDPACGDCNTNNVPDECELTASAVTEIIDATGDGSGTLDTPQGVAVDAAGNTYVTNSNGNNAFKITPAGVITEIIDATGDGTGNTLATPFGIAVDAAGNAYVVGRNSENAFKITPAGVITEIIDRTGDGGGNGLSLPFGIAVDVAGNVFVAGFTSDNAFKITPAGVITEIIDATGDGAGNGLDAPVLFAIAVDAAGNAYVTGANSHNAFKITPAGVITEIIDATGDGGGNPLMAPKGIAVDAAGNVYVAGSNSSNAFKITPAGVITQILDTTGDGAGNTLAFPIGIAVDAAGDVYVAVVASNNAFKITPAGVITEIIDVTGDGGGNMLFSPNGIAVDASGTAYVVGSGSDNVFRIAATLDCNGNGILDECDIADGTSDDNNTNNIPDECEGPANDCNNNGVEDAVDIAGCDGVPACGDCDQDGEPDECSWDVTDCDSSGLSDECEIAEGLVGDCNGNGIPDECVIAGCDGDPACGDCDQNGEPDECSWDVTDCDSSGLSDECEIAEGLVEDCNNNGIPDECDIADCAADPACDDCNVNGVPDGCEIPIVAQETQHLFAAGAATNDFFGSAASQSGNIVLISEPQDGAVIGAAQLFNVSTGQFLAKIVAADRQVGDQFGSSVAISGGAAIVGAPFDEPAPPVSSDNFGSAYLFNVSDPSAAFQTFKITAADAALGDEFGSAVAIDDATGVAVVGAANHAGLAGTTQGSVYLFDVDTGLQLAQLTALDADAGDRFGTSVAIRGNIVMVGAPLDDDDGNASGSVYVFDVTNPGNAFQIAKIVASDAGAIDQLGSSVAIGNQTAIVGAKGLAAAYLFDISVPANPIERAKLTAFDAAAGDDFAESVAISSDGTIAVVGARRDDDVADGSGSAYTFDVSDPANPVQGAKLLADDASQDDNFGKSVAVDGGFAVVGAWGDNNTRGSAYVFSVTLTDADGNGVLDECE